ncbi:MAG TPA: DUF3293 domain-containing protein [Noviherbaspirillum sp.]|uniref:DUF3293 domain-containing protein n=1 Tax=Noviherbaspirillum sp. TaxID=1926288 RepID=UPI002B462667|nr:DUF3293 domain-containing protein [Noviherbaspirillum sp.]HJV84528.1 DUF3293 domain-containing protein [Noviherbaspirillum sp.]
MRLLKARNAMTAAIISATNLSGVAVTIRAAKARQKVFVAAIQRLQLECIPAQQLQMPDKETCSPAYLVFGISGAQAEALLVEFGQQALLWCNQVGPPELMLHPALRRCGCELMT